MITIEQFLEEEKNLLINVLRQLTFNVEGLAQANIVKGILDKLGYVPAQPAAPVVEEAVVVEEVPAEVIAPDAAPQETPPVA